MLGFLRRWRRRRPAANYHVAVDLRDVSAFFEAPFIYGAVDRSHLDGLVPHFIDTVLASADAALQHEFNLLGCGPFVPDLHKVAVGGYRPIDWALDPVAGQRFPNDRPSEGCDIASIRPPGADIKRPWEMGRCYHWVTLAQAWLLTRDARYAREIFDECDDFMAANPIGRGIQWTCTMDAAIRAANWTIALQIVRGAPVDEDRWVRAIGSLLAHGRFIRLHPENHYEVTSNHFLSDVVGLMAVARACPWRSEVAEWLTFATASVEHEMTVQVFPEGADYESSVPYHRLVTELFFAAARMADAAGAPLSPPFRSRLRRMHDFMGAVLRPDGLMPQIGDADDGRLHVFRGHDRQRPQDPRHLFGPAAAMFNEPRFAELAGMEGAWDAAWWGLQSASVPSVIPPVDASFPKAGIAVRRDTDGGYLLITNGAVGTRGFGNHKHNDLLSFEYHVGGRAVIVDPGSFVYTSDPDARNLMRSVVSHNTMAPEGVEQNEFKPEWLFRMFERAAPEQIEYRADPAVFHYVGRHRGYAPAGLIVARAFTWTPGRLEIRDTVQGEPPKPILLAWRFHLAPEIGATIDGNLVRLTLDSADVVLTCPDTLDLGLEPAWYSPSYGVRLPSRQIVARGAHVPRDWTFTLRTMSVRRASTRSRRAGL